MPKTLNKLAYDTLGLLLISLNPDDKPDEKILFDAIKRFKETRERKDLLVVLTKIRTKRGLSNYGLDKPNKENSHGRSKR